MPTKKIKVGIVGGAGYTGGELIRLLINHPNVDISFVHSNSNSGKKLFDVHTDLLGETEMSFTKKISDKIDVLFLCMGHGESEKFLKKNKINGKIKIIDLSQDYRYRSVSSSEFRVQSSKKLATRNSKLAIDFIYGLPELNREKIKKTQYIANPGCFATCIQLALLPLVAKKEIKSEIHISAITGSTGAGRSLAETSHFTWRNNNISVYKAFTHQHLYEISQSMHQLDSKFNSEINFIPFRGNFSRGILASVYLGSKLTESEVKKIFSEYYKNHPFIHISNKSIDVKQVVNTNKCVLHIEKYHDKLLITSAIDNLLKGASGQAVQNMNLMFGLKESAGLNLKATAF